MTRMMCGLFVGLQLSLLIGTACNTESRLNRLEKETKEMRQEAVKRQASTDYDLQARCSRDAREWFKENWSREKDTVFLDYTDHYNKALNKYFIRGRESLYCRSQAILG